MLDKINKNDIKQMLNFELKEITLSINELKKLLTPVAPDNAIGRLSRMDALEMQSVNTTKLNQQQQRVKKIKQALFRLENNDNFGTCFECGQAINPQRLMLKPESQYCVDCQQILDDG